MVFQFVGLSTVSWWHECSIAAHACLWQLEVWQWLAHGSDLHSSSWRLMVATSGLTTNTFYGPVEFVITTFHLLEDCPHQQPSHMSTVISSLTNINSLIAITTFGVEENVDCYRYEKNLPWVHDADGQHWQWIIFCLLFYRNLALFFYFFFPFHFTFLWLYFSSLLFFLSLSCPSPSIFSLSLKTEHFSLPVSHTASAWVYL